MSRYPVAYQLYSSRLFPPILAHLPRLKDMGYDAIEPWLPAYEEDPAHFRQALDDSGLKCFGFHTSLSGLVAEPQKFIDMAHILGATYIIPPFIPEEEREPTPDYWRRVGHALQNAGEIAAKDGLKVAWHNHAFEYEALPDGTRPIDHIMAEGGESLWLELDCGWVTRGQSDPAEELARYADRIAIVQLKDTAPAGTEINDGWAATGDGTIEWERLKPYIEATAADHLCTEHDNPSDWAAFARRSIDYIRSIGL